jgi:hypothetical protein
MLSESEVTRPGGGEITGATHNFVTISITAYAGTLPCRASLDDFKNLLCRTSSLSS